MSAPISFPTIAPPQVVQRKSSLDGFAEFLAALNAQRDERMARREQLDMERMRTESALDTDKLTRAQKLKELEIADLSTQAEEAAAPYVLEYMSLGDKGDEVAALEIARRMQEQNKDKKLTPYLSRAYSAGIKSGQEGLAAVAQRRAAESGARVAGATEDADIEAGKLKPEVQKAQLAAANAALRNAQLEATLKLDEINLDPSRRQQITQFLQGGRTLGEAYAAVGRTVPAGADPNMRLDNGIGGTASEATRKQEGLASQAMAGNVLVEAAQNRPLNARADAFRSITGKGGIVGALGRAVLNPSLTPEDRQVLQGYQLIGQAWAQHITGATATDQQMQTFVNTIVTFASDDPATAQQKIAMRRLLPALIQRGLEPTQIVDALIQQGLQLGMAPQKIKDLQAVKATAAKYQTSPEYRQGVKRGPAAPSDATAPRVDPAIAAGFRVGPPDAR